MSTSAISSSTPAYQPAPSNGLPQNLQSAAQPIQPGTTAGAQSPSQGVQPGMKGHHGRHHHHASSSQDAAASSPASDTTSAPSSNAVDVSA